MLVYRNLHKNCWSIKNKGLVIAHAEGVYLEGVKFHVNLLGQRRVREARRKMVHAYVTGEVKGVWGLIKRRDCDLREVLIAEISGKVVSYNPFSDPGFMCNGDVVSGARRVWMAVRKGKSLVIADGVIGS